MGTVGAVGSPGALAITTKTANYTAAVGDQVMCNAVGGVITITLPTGAANNSVVGVKKQDTSTNAVTVAPGAGSTIDGDTTCSLPLQGAGATFQFDSVSSVWRITSTALLNTNTQSITSQFDGAIIPTYTTQRWFDRRTYNPAMTNSLNATQAQTPVAAALILYVPCYVYSTITIDTVALATGATAPTSGATVRLGAYTNSATGVPTTLLYDWGVLSLGSTASALLTLAAAGTIPRGWFWFCLSFNSGFNPGSILSVPGSGAMSPNIGLPTGSFTFANTAFGGPNMYYSQSGTGAALAGTMSGATASPAVSAITAAPNVWYKIA